MIDAQNKKKIALYLVRYVYTLDKKIYLFKKREGGCREKGEIVKRM